MDDYLKTMADYSPNLEEQHDIETEIIEISNLPLSTALAIEDNPKEEISYLAPKTIKVRRYTLKK